MDETAMRSHFERVVSQDAPPSMVDVARARTTGRRQLRMRWVGIPSASVGVALAIGLLFAGGALPGRAPSRPLVG